MSWLPMLAMQPLDGPLTQQVWLWMDAKPSLHQDLFVRCTEGSCRRLTSLPYTFVCLSALCSFAVKSSEAGIVQGMVICGLSLPLKASMLMWMAIRGRQCRAGRLKKLDRGVSRRDPGDSPGSPGFPPTTPGPVPASAGHGSPGTQPQAG